MKSVAQCLSASVRTFGNRRIFEFSFQLRSQLEEISRIEAEEAIGPLLAGAGNENVGFSGLLALRVRGVARGFLDILGCARRRINFRVARNGILHTISHQLRYLSIEVVEL